MKLFAFWLYLLRFQSYPCRLSTTRLPGGGAWPAMVSRGSSALQSGPSAHSLPLPEGPSVCGARPGEKTPGRKLWEGTWADFPEERGDQGGFRLETLLVRHSLFASCPFSQRTKSTFLFFIWVPMFSLLFLHNPLQRKDDEGLPSEDGRGFCLKKVIHFNNFLIFSTFFERSKVKCANFTFNRVCTVQETQQATD